MQLNQLMIIFGAIVGTSSPTNTTVTNCYYLQGTCAGAINLKDTVEAPESRTAEQMQEDAFVTKLNEGNDETVWLKDKDNKNEGYPVLNKGYKEIILIAQDTTKYGIDIYGQSKLAELLVEISKIEKISLGFIHLKKFF